MFDWASLFNSEAFMPHGHCYLWTPALLWTFVVADAVIALSYYSIPAALVYFVRKRNDLQFDGIFLMFSSFIFFCGTTHLVDIWTVWNPDYAIDAAFKAITALVSFVTAIALWVLMPKALAIPSTADLRATVTQLQSEVRERRSAEQKLEELNATLEERVQQRTQELEQQLAEVRRLQDADRARQAAEAASRAKTEFMSRMSHELRTPMNAVLGFNQLLLVDAREPLTRTQRERAEQVQQAGIHLLNMINDILDITRIEAGRLDLSLEPVAAGDVLTRCVALIAAEARTRQVTVAADVMPDTPQVRADATRLQQVLLNLLSNAVKYNRPNGSVRVGLARVPGAFDRVRIAVTDTGLGMSAAQLAELFQPFNRLGREHKGIDGTGIGLVIVKQLVEHMGGTIDVTSEPDVGSTFTIELPVA